MADSSRPDPAPPYRSTFRPARNPIIKPGETLTLYQILDRLPPPNPGFLRDIERAQSEDPPAA